MEVETCSFAPVFVFGRWTRTGSAGQQHIFRCIPWRLVTLWCDAKPKQSLIAGLAWPPQLNVSTLLTLLFLENSWLSRKNQWREEKDLKTKILKDSKNSKKIPWENRTIINCVKVLISFFFFKNWNPENRKWNKHLSTLDIRSTDSIKFLTGSRRILHITKPNE